MAVTIHNIPEGLAVGVGAGAARPEIAKREALEDLDPAALAALQRAVSQMSQR